MFVQYGTPLIDDSSGSNRALIEPVPRWKKRDENERVKERFHGAFTGGFSAGYFNTVGSKEGWSPSSFHSSRKERSSGNSSNNTNISPYSRPEDFMDEEDLRDQEDSITLVPADIPKSLGQISIPEKSAESFLDSKVKLLLGGESYSTSSKPHFDPVGYNILLRMGWKAGEGIGPKLSRSVNLGEKRGLVNYEIAPKNVVLSIQPYSTSHGIGYNIDTPELPILVSNNANNNPIPTTKIKKRKLAMNLSIAASYDDDDEDDDDDSTIRNKWAPKYDLKEISRKPKSIGNKRFGFKGNSTEQPPVQFVRRKCTDGTLVPTGFALSTRMLYTPKKFALPVIGGRTNSNAALLSTQQASIHPEKPADSKNRAHLLQEPPLPGKSIFELLSPDARNRIEKQKNGMKAEDVDKKLDLKPQINKSTDEDIPYLSEVNAQEALSNTKYPYAENLEKRDRYLSVLRIYSNQSEEHEKFFSSLMAIKPLTMSYNDWINELNEFSKVAIVFRPLKGAIADRFTASSGAAGVKREEQLFKSEYDPSTFKIIDFFPERLLCKRFGVPYIGLTRAPVARGPELGQIKSSDESSTKVTPDTSDKTTIDPNQNEALESERAPASLFSMVFGGSGEETDDYDDDL